MSELEDGYTMPKKRKGRKPLYVPTDKPVGERPHVSIVLDHENLAYVKEHAVRSRYSVGHLINYLVTLGRKAEKLEAVEPALPKAIRRAVKMLEAWETGTYKSRRAIGRSKGASE